MKNIFKSLMLVAVAAMGFTACEQVGIETSTPGAHEVIMTINADVDETRTYIDETNSIVKWSEGDQLTVIENSKNYSTTSQIAISPEGNAKFTVSFPANTTDTEFTYNAVFPASAVTINKDDIINSAKVKVTIKDQQKPIATSFDPQADVLVAKQIVTNTQPAELNMQFKRLVALGKMTLTGLPNDAMIAKVIFTAGEKDILAGRNYVNTTTGEVAEYGYFGKTNAITLNYNEPISTRNIYFTCNPFEMEAGEIFKVKVICEHKTYTREVTIPEGRSLIFTEGNLGTFTVDMKSATVENNVTFADGKYVVLAKSDNKYYAMKGAKGNGNYMDYVAGIEYDGTAETIEADESLAWTISSVEDGFTFQNSEGEYLYWSSGNYAYLGDDSKAQAMTINAIDGTNQYYVAVKDTPERVLSYNASSPRFAFYGNKGQVCQLFLVRYFEDTTPRFAVTPKELQFDSNGNAYDSDCFIIESINGFDIESISATTDADWITIEPDGDTYTIIVTANNSSTKRTADIVFSATGIADITTQVHQDAKPAHTTIAAFLEAEEDDTTMYILNGTITAVANTTYGNFDLTDDTGTVYIYGLMSPDGATNKYWAASGAKLGDDIVIKTVRTSFNGAPQGKDAWFVELVSPGTRAFYTVDPVAVDFASAGGEQTIGVTAYNTDAAVSATSDNAAFVVSVDGYNVTVSAAANELEQEITGNIAITVGDLEATIVKATLAAKPASGVVEGGSDDFHTISSTNTSYVSGTTTAGWNYKNCAIFKGGSSDSSPAFKMIGDASNRALCMNGKTSAVGTITSPTLTTGCGTLKFNYGLPFSDTKIKFRVDIIQGGAVVKTFTINNASASKTTKYSHEENINVAGDFQIKFTNLSPSNSTSNKDRTAIWDVEWTGYKLTSGDDTGGGTTPPAVDPNPGTDNDDNSDSQATETWLELPAARTDGAYPNATEVKISSNGERNYTHYYDTATYTSLWVAYPLESKHMGSIKRPDDWSYNPNISQSAQINLCDSSYSGNYSRGHLIPNASRNGIRDMQLQTFYVTNSVPQIQDNFNGGIWNTLEKAIQDIAKNERIYVVTGVAFNKKGENKTIKYTKAKDDSRSVPVPNYFYKVILKVNTNSNGEVTSASTIGFWFEHKTYSDSFTNYNVSVDQIEQWTGFNFFANLPDAVENNAEGNSSWNTFSSF